MREVQPASLQYFQLELPGQTTRCKRSKVKPRATSSTYSLLRSNSRSGIKSRTTSYACSTQSTASHNCIAIDNSTLPQDSQHILVGSALRRPHATGFSPLDYQTMPDVGKSPRQPYRSQSACTVYGYVSRPLSAKQVQTRNGKHTKSSLLRNKSTSCDSIASKSTSCSSTPTENRPASSKRLCQIRDDYRFFKKGPIHKQIPPHGESLHSFLTGARYNRTRYLDSRTLSKLGVYIPKTDLKTFFVKDPPVEYDDDDEESNFGYNIQCDQNIPDLVASEDSFSPSSKEEELQKPETQDIAINTEPHFLSIERWHSVNSQTDRKPTKQKAPRAHTAPSRFKPVTTLYHDYNTGQKYKYSDVS